MYKAIRFNSKSIKGTVQLPASKSISNRLLILQALYGGFEIENISQADDTVLLEEALASEAETINVGMAGTAMRFLLAYYATTGQAKILTGSSRMKERPIGPLVDALNQLGADITYLEKEGYPPLKIDAVKPQGGNVKISGGVSSQYISALLMIAPSLENGLQLEITDGLVSEPYVEMTIGLLGRVGYEVEKITNRSHQITNLVVRSNNPLSNVHNLQCVESDWSAVSYWYAFAALAEEADIFIPNLSLPSLQGDAIICEWMKDLGVETIWEEGGARLRKVPFQQKSLNFDFLAHPDLAQTVIVLCAALDIDATFTGLQTLKIKETDRIAALQLELKKFGKYLVENGDAYTLQGQFKASRQTINTYNDHRMAMAFAPLALVCDELEIESPEVVSKSYPNFWEQVVKFIP